MSRGQNSVAFLYANKDVSALDMVMCACNPNTEKAESRGS